MPEREYKTLRATVTQLDGKTMNPGIIGTAWDPEVANGAPVVASRAVKSGPSRAQLERRAAARAAAYRKSQPLRVATFEC